MNKNEAYKQTQRDPKEHVQSYKKRFEVFPDFPTSTWEIVFFWSFFGDCFREWLQILVSQELCHYFVIIPSAFEKQKNFANCSRADYEKHQFWYFQILIFTIMFCKAKFFDEHLFRLSILLKEPG